MHLIEQQQVRKRTHAPSLSLSVSAYLSLFGLLTCLRACKACASYEHGGGAAAACSARKSSFPLQY
jgi:hypothetical protein